MKRLLYILACSAVASASPALWPRQNTSIQIVQAIDNFDGIQVGETANLFGTGDVSTFFNGIAYNGWTLLDQNGSSTLPPFTSPNIIYMNNYTCTNYSASFTPSAASNYGQPVLSFQLLSARMACSAPGNTLNQPVPCTISIRCQSTPIVSGDPTSFIYVSLTASFVPATGTFDANGNPPPSSFENVVFADINPGFANRDLLGCQLSATGNGGALGPGQMPVLMIDSVVQNFTAVQQMNG